MVSGKRIHGTGAIAGGMNKSLTKAERDYLLEDIDQMITWAEGSVALIKKCIAPTCLITMILPLYAPIIWD